jgi:arabinose-5-phosphate isomerase
MIDSVAGFVRVEAKAVAELATRLDGSMAVEVEKALRLFETCAATNHRLIVTGIGKSGLIARKIAATLCSTGTSAVYLHPAEALHGDLGMAANGDVALALSYSGETEEILRLLPAFERLAVPVVSLCGEPTSSLATRSAVWLDVGVSEEACSLNLAPTASTTVMLALGDALALELSRRCGFKATDFAALHPGGRLGRRLARVRERMHTGSTIPQVAPGTAIPEVIYEMSRKKLGMTTVLAGDQLVGLVSDGDLRRLLERVGREAFDKTAGEVMNSSPVTIAPGALASEALALMEEKKITSLVVIGGEGVEGVVHLHDLWDQSEVDRS